MFLIIKQIESTNKLSGDSERRPLNSVFIIEKKIEFLVSGRHALSPC